MHLDLSRIAQQLYEDPAVRKRIIRNFGIAESCRDAGTLAKAALSALDQMPEPDPLNAVRTNQAVFRAAVRAIGSNSRSWAVFLRKESAVRELLCGYEPVRADAALRETPTLESRLRQHLPGTTSTADARAVVVWARLLATTPDFYVTLIDIAQAFIRLDQEQHGQRTTNEHLMLLLAMFLAAPSRRWLGRQYLRQPVDPSKLPGMGTVLASEFLRNLGWSGFKPDRHIRRLLTRWFPAHPERSSARVGQLLKLTARSTAPAREFVACSLVGAAVTPSGIPLSTADNLVWLLAAYVEKKGHETARRYWNET